MIVPGETEAGCGATTMPGDNLAGSSDRCFAARGVYLLALALQPKKSSDDRPRCPENPRPEGRNLH